MKKMVAMLLLMSVGVAGAAFTGSGIVTTLEEFVDVLEYVRWQVQYWGVDKWGVWFFWCVCEDDRDKVAYAWKIYFKHGTYDHGNRDAGDVVGQVRRESSRYGGCHKDPEMEPIRQDEGTGTNDS